jgi:hypothetical protein
MFTSGSRGWARGSLVLAVAAVAAWVLVRYLQLKYAGPGIGFDTSLYQSYARSWGSGGTPYVDFRPEYPPGALPIFLIPLLMGGPDYVRNFAIEMAAFDLATCLVVVAWSRRLHPDEPYRQVQALVVYLLMTAALYPVLYTRFDLAPAAIAMGGLYLHYLNRWRSGLLLLGLAGAVKLWPFALLLAPLVLAFRRGRWPRLLEAGAWAAAGVLLPVALIAPRAGWKVLSFLEYHAARGIEIGATWSTAALGLNLLGLVPAHPEHDFGAFHVKGPAASLFATLSMPALVLMAMAPQIRAAWRIRAGDDAVGRVGLAASAASVLGFMIAGKVLSPQFALWLVPFLPLVMDRPVTAIMAVAAAVLTTAEYPFLAAPLEMLAPGHARAVIIVGIRNLLLVALYVVAWRRLAKKPVKSAHSSPATNLAPRGVVL